MPQDTLLPDLPPLTGLAITWEEVVKPKGRLWQPTVRLRSRGEDYRTVFRQEWRGLELDLAMMFSEDVTASFFFDDPSGPAKAAFTVARLARAHRRRYERVG